MGVFRWPLLQSVSWLSIPRRLVGGMLIILMLVRSWNIDRLLSLDGQRGVGWNRISVGDGLGDIDGLPLNMCCGVLTQKVHQADQLVQLVD